MIQQPIPPMPSRMSRRTPPVRATLCTWLAGSLALALAACGAAPAPLGDTEQPYSAGDDHDASSEEGSSTDACAGGEDVQTASGQCSFVARALCFSTSEAACACAGCGLSECAIAESFPAQAFCPGSGGGSDPDGSTSDDPNTPVSSEPQGGGSNGSSGDPVTGTIGGGSSGSPGNAGGGSAPGSPGGGSHDSPGCTDPNAPACSTGVPHDPTGAERCDFIVGDTCFDSAASACACAGCAAGRCLVLESYPAQIRCE